LTEGKQNLSCQACRDRKVYDKRTPGLFKLEFEGEGMISLCSKTYHCFGAYNKTSTKGLSKRQNNLDRDIFFLTRFSIQKRHRKGKMKILKQTGRLFTHMNNIGLLFLFYILKDR
jgi:hypothetical protein